MNVPQRAQGLMPSLFCSICGMTEILPGLFVLFRIPAAWTQRGQVRSISLLLIKPGFKQLGV
jgi:hypothetical protein